MKQMINYWQVRYPTTAQLSKKARGVMIGRLSTAIREAAKSIGLDVNMRHARLELALSSRGEHITLVHMRHARLELASDVFEREVMTFNELSDAELWTINQWVLPQNAEGLAEMADMPWINAVVLLALKPVGRAADNDLTPVTYPEFKEIVEYAAALKIPLGFDSCTAPKFMQYVNESDMSQREKDRYATVCEPCEAAALSAYFNVFGDFYPCSFMEGVGDWETGLPVLNCDDFLSDVCFHKRVVRWRDNLLSRGRTCPQYNI